MDLMTAIDQLMHEAEVEAAPAWEGAPLHFTTNYYPPEQLEAAFRRWSFEHGHLGSIPRSHMWHSSPTGGRFELAAHDLHEFSADLRCDRWKHLRHIPGETRPPACECVNVMLTQIICSRCEWHHIATDSNETVEAWHDHAFPGWRELPVLPKKLRGKMGTQKMTPKLGEWFEENYPAHFRVDGAPILTERDGLATRHVPGYSPFGGYDLSVQS